jgi:DNA-directed RNA polymerase specialized sigma24 family protein
MFPFQPKPERRPSFEDIFFEHYTRLLEWALQLTRRDRSEAEDLVQELYIRFARLGAIPERIENAESYLFTVLRNLHYTRARRARTGAVDSLSIVDYDSVQHGLRAVDRSELLSIRSDLYRICDYLYNRKESSRSASIFILRYFLGYFPNEVMRVVQSSRVAVDKAIQAVRREARLDLERPGAIRSIGDKREHKLRMWNSTESDQNLFLALRAKIFASCSGECFGLPVLGEKYAQPAQSFTTQELAHLVSCTTCLDQANHILGLPLLEDRSPDDSIGRNTPQGPNSSAGSTPTLVSSRPSRRTNGMERHRSRLRRRAEEVDQHRPQRLLVVVDGDVRASQKVTAPLNELRVELGRIEKPAFIEVLSEQGYCLVFVPVQQPGPESDLYQTQEASLSDDRSLKVVVSFIEETPSIQVVYLDPLVAAEADSLDVQADTPGIAARQTLPAFEETNVIAWPGRLWSRIAGTFSLKMNPFLVSAMLFGLCSVVCLFLWTRSGPRISPRTFLTRAQHSDAVALASSNDGVIYQKVRISMPGHAVERAIYRDPQGKRKPIQQHLGTDDQRLKDRLDIVGVNWNEPLSAANYAEWHDRQTVKQDVLTKTGNNLLTLTSSTDTDSPVLKESLTVRMSDFHPVERTIELRDEGTVEIAELNYDVMPWGAVNQDWFEPLTGGVPSAANIHPSLRLPHVLSDLELDEAELEARVVLNQLHADQGEQIHLDRSASGIEVKGVVDTDERKRQIVSELLQVPHVRPSILSVEEIGSNPMPMASHGMPIQAYSVEAQQSPLEQYLRAQKLPLDQLATVSQDLLSGCLRIQQAETHLSELHHRFRDDNQLPEDQQQQLKALSQNYDNVIRDGLDADKRTLLSLGFTDSGQPASAPTSGPTEDDLGQQVRHYQELCQELITSGAGQHRPAAAIADELMTSGTAIRARITQTQTVPSAAKNNN